MNVKKKCQIWKMVLHPAPSTDNASCTTTPWQKKHTEKWSYYCQGVVVQEALSIEGAGCKIFFLPGGSGAGGIINWGGWVQNHFSDLTLFFYIQFKNTSNLILLGFKLSSERFLFKNFKTDLTFSHIWFFNFQNLVRSCQHIDGTPCISRFHCSK